MWQASKNIYHLIMAILATILYGFASKNLTVIGVTGTDGKTTTVHLIYHILKFAGKKVSMISSIGAVLNGENYDTGFHVTTPSSWKLQKFLSTISASPKTLRSQRRDEGAKAETNVSRTFQKGESGFSEADVNLSEKTPPFRAGKFINSRTLRQPSDINPYLVLEVTSHALDQYRAWGIDFAVGVLTNVTNEHLDYHKTYENYVKTKAKLLQMAKMGVVNKDDNSFRVISNFQFPISNFQLITYGMSQNADVNPQNFPFKTKLLGEFNRYNCLASIAAAQALGINDKMIKRALLTFTPPIGRLDVVYDKAFKIIIDMAHTSNGLENVLSAVRPNVQGRLIHVFGSAGERDFLKRPEMGRISAKYADIIVLTAEDPRSESVKKIIEQIAAGVEDSNKVQIFKIPNRQEAINFAVSMARNGDVIIITGKGHEQSMNYGKGEEPWSEHEAVRKAIKGL